jgi:farnesyl-diphosphate farnesyltransferase
MRDLDICWEILPKVSRSFALCIRILPKPLNEQMMLSYLIYRVLDTIEDSSASLETKKGLFGEFLALLGRRKFEQAATEKCRGNLLSMLNYTYERDLLENAPALLRAYYAQPVGVRMAIRKRGRTMAAGMFKFQQKRIETFSDQNRYSHYVAGVIGYLFNDLLLFNRIITRGLWTRLHRYARDFGLALQKVNILRDIANDISQKRHYWPRMLMAKYRLTYESICSDENRTAALGVLREQIENARKYLVSAMKYILLLPKKALRVRMFCIIPLFMAIESYVKCMNNLDVFDRSKVVKISRLQVEEIVAKSGLWGTSNPQLVRWFLKSMTVASPQLHREYASFFYARQARR